MTTLRSMLGLLVAALALPVGCGNDDGLPTGGTIDESLPTPELVCPSYAADAYPDMAPMATVNASSVGAIDGAFSISSVGSARYAIPLTVPPARKAPNVSLVYDSGAPHGILGKGFAVAGLSSIHRCGSNLAQDDRMRGITLSSADHYCLDGARLVQIGIGKDSIGTFAEYHTFPDSQTRVRGYGAPTANEFDLTYFVANLPNGDEVRYGESMQARVVWRGFVTRAWHKELEVDRRGNTIRYTYAARIGNSGTTQEDVIDTITYAGFIDERGVETAGNAVIDFEYEDQPRYGKLFYQGEEISRRMQLARIDMRKNGLTVRSYRFDYDMDTATNEALALDSRHEIVVRNLARLEAV